MLGGSISQGAGAGGPYRTYATLYKVSARLTPPTFRLGTQLTVMPSMATGTWPQDRQASALAPVAGFQLCLLSLTWESLLCASGAHAGVTSVRLRSLPFRSGSTPPCRPPSRPTRRVQPGAAQRGVPLHARRAFHAPNTVQLCGMWHQRTGSPTRARVGVPQSRL